MSEAWAIALFGAMTTVMAFMAKALWDIKSAFCKVVSRADCDQKMDGHCDELAKLRKTAEKNSKALTQIVTHIGREHGIKIDY